MWHYRGRWWGHHADEQEEVMKMNEAYRNRLADQVSAEIDPRQEEADLRWLDEAAARAEDHDGAPVMATLDYYERFAFAGDPDGEDTPDLVDEELPGMWETADFMGGDPDERSYAERAADQRLDQFDH